MRKVTGKNFTERRYRRLKVFSMDEPVKFPQKLHSEIKSRRCR
jgi:hypothetical protein